jgi:hypothetical protein
MKFNIFCEDQQHVLNAQIHPSHFASLELQYFCFMHLSFLHNSQICRITCTAVPRSDLPPKALVLHSCFQHYFRSHQDEDVEITPIRQSTYIPGLSVFLRPLQSEMVDHNVFAALKRTLAGRTVAPLSLIPLIQGDKVIIFQVSEVRTTADKTNFDPDCSVLVTRTTSLNLSPNSCGLDTVSETSKSYQAIENFVEDTLSKAYSGINVSRFGLLVFFVCGSAS